MKKLTYNEAYNLIIDAYFKDEIQPYKSEFCFCGTLNNGNSIWNTSDIVCKHYNFPYTYDEFKAMEKCLFGPLRNMSDWKPGLRTHEQPMYENTLFEGMSKALDVLKEIHRGRGEDVDNEQKFTKRELKLVEV